MYLLNRHLVRKGFPFSGAAIVRLVGLFLSYLADKLPFSSSKFDTRHHCTLPSSFRKQFGLEWPHIVLFVDDELQRLLSHLLFDKSDLFYVKIIDF